MIALAKFPQESPFETAHLLFSALGMQPIEDLAEMADTELLVIDEGTRLSDFKKELRWNQAHYHLAGGL